MALDTKKRNARQNAWLKSERDRINLVCPKGMHQKLQIEANADGISVNELINRAILRELKAPHRYGMRLRGFSPGCQPKEGLLGATESDSGKYYNILMYSRLLTEEECKAYELDYLGKGE